MNQERDLGKPFQIQTEEYLTGPARLGGIAMFPAKSLAPWYLDRAFVDQMGIRREKDDPTSDRQYMVVNKKSQMVTQRTQPEFARMHLDVLDGGEMQQLVFDGDHLLFPLHKHGKIDTTVHTTKDIPAVDQGHAVASWLEATFGKELRFVRQVDDQPRERNEPLIQIAGLQQLLRLQDSSPITAMAHAGLYQLNQLLPQSLNMEAISFRMNLLIFGEINEHAAVGKFLRIGLGEDAIYLYIWRPKERCPMPGVDQNTGVHREADKKRLGDVYQVILRSEQMHDLLGIPEHLRHAPKKNGPGWVPKSMLGADLFPINPGYINAGDPIAIVNEVPQHILQAARERMRIG